MEDRTNEAMKAIRIMITKFPLPAPGSATATETSTAAREASPGIAASGKAAAGAPSARAAFCLDLPTLGQQIADGRADGTIAADDLDVNLNLAVAKILHAVAYLAVAADLEIKNDFSIEGDIDAVSDAKIERALDEIESALDNLEVVADVADIDISDIRAQFREFRRNLL